MLKKYERNYKIFEKFRISAFYIILKNILFVTYWLHFSLHQPLLFTSNFNESLATMDQLAKEAVIAGTSCPKISCHISWHN